MHFILILLERISSYEVVQSRPGVVLYLREGYAPWFLQNEHHGLPQLYYRSHVSPYLRKYTRPLVFQGAQTNVKTLVWETLSVRGKRDIFSLAKGCCRSWGRCGLMFNMNTLPLSQHHPFRLNVTQPHSGCRSCVGFASWRFPGQGTPPDSQHTLALRLGRPGLPGIFSHHLIQLTTWCWSVGSSAPLFTRASKIWGHWSISMTTKPTIGLLCLNMVLVTEKMWLVQKSNNKASLGFRSARPHLSRFHCRYQCER